MIAQGSQFAAFIQNLKLSDVKLLLLRELWGKADSFPKEWVKSSVLLKMSGQKYFDRRLRELRDAGGLDIESRVIDGEYCWRLNSAHIAATNNRTYLTATQKSRLFSEAKNCCSICGLAADAGIRGLQADHKIPLIKGGGEDYSNWQALCNECNVAKRGVCKDCDLDCNSCAWAFPEKVGFRFVFTIPSELQKKIDAKKLSNLQIQQFLIEQLEKI